eukprot:CAMPEP_0182556016 /NCGR_PEP_ID=MMETSP1324-20130603/427_1 /TAXON_ID=236786 /ORGANISM="Florenciella sp., Strain RCC1587" /LENGTH=133 /DNA_ID=CAMNT_0024767839 /DNA_START=140 /DNA_END=540 /DNA_ORIENTATION=-
MHRPGTSAPLPPPLAPALSWGSPGGTIGKIRTASGGAAARFCAHGHRLCRVSSWGSAAWLGLCSVWVAINAAIERTRVVHAGPRHGWAVPTLGGVGGGRVVACGRVVGVVAGVEELGVWRRLIVGVSACWSHR